ncbi:MAG: sigma 54-interacting transcriptional regulator [Alkalispirochaetaceae bacterium]
MSGGIDRSLLRQAGIPEEIGIVLNSTQEGIIAVDRDSRITLWNRAAEGILGIEATEALGKPIREVIPVTRLPQVIDTGESELSGQLTIDGVTILTDRMPLVNEAGEILGAFAVFRDISELEKLAEEITNLREMRILQEAIFNSTQDAISVVDEHGIGVTVNPAYTRVTGYTPGEVIGKPCTVDIASGESIHLKVLRNREPIRGERLQVGVDKRMVIVDAAPIIVRGELKGSVAVIKDLSEIHRLNSRLDQAHRMIRKLEAKYSFDDLIGEDPAFLRAVERARVAAATPATVMLRGESGTGKELFAHAIHNASDLRANHFVRVNCASLAESVLESELFGYEEGAFTGAVKGGRHGLFEQAHGGTIFLDEIGLMSLATQGKLLRVLQEKEVRRVGGTRTIPVDVRVIAATNLDLRRAIAAGSFREDLYYRINVMPISIPPLRERKGDIPLLAGHLIHRINQEYGRSIEGVAAEAVDRLIAYDWPGNVRELENALRRAVITMAVPETRIEVEHLPELRGGGRAQAGRGELSAEGEAITREESSAALRPLAEVSAEAEARAIRHALEGTGGSRQQAARILDISLRTLQYKMRRYRIR